MLTIPYNRLDIAFLTSVLYVTLGTQQEARNLVQGKVFYAGVNIVIQAFMQNEQLTNSAEHLEPTDFSSYQAVGVPSYCVQDDLLPFTYQGW